MKEQATGNRQRATGNIPALLRRAMPPLGEEAAPSRDLWPMMRARLNQGSDAAVGIGAVPWFDWALAGGVAVCALAFPAAIPVLLYYL